MEQVGERGLEGVGMWPEQGLSLRTRGTQGGHKETGEIYRAESPVHLPGFTVSPALCNPLLTLLNPFSSAIAFYH